MAELGSHDPRELKRFEKKYKAIERAKWRLRQRLETIDWEIDELQPGYEAQIELVVKTKRLPEVVLVDPITPVGDKLIEEVEHGYVPTDDVDEPEAPPA